MPIVMPVSDAPALDAVLKALGWFIPIMVVAGFLAYLKLNRPEQLRTFFGGLLIALLVSLPSLNSVIEVILTEQDVVIKRLLVGRTVIPREEITGLESYNVRVRGAVSTPMLALYTSKGERYAIQTGGKERDQIRITLQHHLNLQP